MTLSEFETRVCEALIRGNPEEETLRSQLNSAVVKKRDYTGVGLFTEIKVAENCYRLSQSFRYIEQVPKIHLEHPDLSTGAGAMLWFHEGFISTLECFTYEGDWPKDETLFTVNA